MNMVKVSVILYGTLGCHLCEQAQALLQQLQEAHQFEWQAVDIADNVIDADRFKEWSAKIPILYSADRWLMWPFGLLDLERFMFNPE